MKQREIKDITDLKELLFDQKDRIITIAGLSKNAGKTSFLNYILKIIPDNFITAITTTGHDGEDADFLTGLKKPKLLINSGVYFTTTPEVANQLSSTIKIIQKLPFNVLSKPLFLVQALQHLETEIFGPHTVTQQIKLCHIFQELGINKIIIDGSLDRKSIAMSPEIDNLILVSSPAFGTTEEITQELIKLANLSSMAINNQYSFNEEYISYIKDKQVHATAFKSLFRHEKDICHLLTSGIDTLFIPGAITENSFNKLKNTLIKFKGELIIKHPLQIMTSNYSTNQILDLNISAQNPFPIDAIGLNSFSTDNRHLDSDIYRETIRNYFKNIPIIDIQEAIQIS